MVPLTERRLHEIMYVISPISYTCDSQDTPHRTNEPPHVKYDTGTWNPTKVHYMYRTGNAFQRGTY